MDDSKHDETEECGVEQVSLEELKAEYEAYKVETTKNMVEMDNYNLMDNVILMILLFL